jgi:hypothetical protein
MHLIRTLWGELKALEGSGDENTERRREEVLGALRTRVDRFDATPASLTPDEKALLEEIRRTLK